ncbi:MAG TPA: (d)CMP kinase, partial [Pirellulaceae bacterium]
EEVLRLQDERDERDKARKVGRLEPAIDAHLVNTDGMTLDEVVAQLEGIARQKLCLSQPGKR